MGDSEAHKTIYQRRASEIIPQNSVKKAFHAKCRNTTYSSDSKKETAERFPVSDDKVSFDVDYPEYQPKEFTSISVLGVEKRPVWADPADIQGSGILFNQVDGNTDRRSHDGVYKIDNNGRPLNISGRTGITGRGMLGKWGPNQAADPIVTRWERNEKDKKIIGPNGKNKLQFISIQRTDTGEWAIPGGMCDPGERISKTLKREFMEEATNSIGKSQESLDKIRENVDKLFNDQFAIEIYKGYVDDPRNTDNAWMETQCYLFHDETGEILKDFKLEAGDDAQKVQWTTIDSGIKLYASHRDLIDRAAFILDAYWSDADNQKSNKEKQEKFLGNI